jgi:hypothetical protein
MLLLLLYNELPSHSIDPGRSERFDCTGSLEKKNTLNYVLHPQKLMHSKNVGMNTRRMRAFFSFLFSVC